MLDDEPTTEDTTSRSASKTSAARPRRRAAARPAGPPVQLDDAGTTSDQPAAKEKPAKKSTKKTAKKAAKKSTKKAAKKSAKAENTAAGEASTTNAAASATSPPSATALLFQPPPVDAAPKPARKTAKKTSSEAPAEADGDQQDTGSDQAEGEGDESSRRRRRRGGRGRRPRKSGDESTETGSESSGDEDASESSQSGSGDSSDSSEEESAGTRRRRRRRRKATGDDADLAPDDPARTVVHVREPRKGERNRGDDVSTFKGSTRLEAKKQRRREGREQGRRRPPVLTESEFLARREAVDRVMVIRQRDELTQIGVLEDDVLVEHYVAQQSATTMVGTVYLGKVQNVLPSMEAAFVDVGRGRNAVLYAGEVNWDAAGLDGQPRRIEHALKSGDSVLVQVTKDPIGHKGARLTAQVSLPGRYLVYVPDGSMTGISRKLPDTERSRLKSILKRIVPDDAGVIVRTAAEGASEDELSRDVARLSAQWESIEEKAKTASAPELLYEEPDLTIRVVRDIFNEDFKKVVVSGGTAAETVEEYVAQVAPDLADRVSRWTSDEDVFSAHRIDEQLSKALDRKVWLPSGGYLIIDPTEAMTVVDVNTGKFTGSGGNLEETVTKNNLEAAEEIVRQLRLRDVGGIIVVDFIDMVLESNRELVLRRLVECLGRDRTKHQVAEVTSLGLVQMTRKRVGQGLLEAFSTTCEHCNGRGRDVHLEPVEAKGAGGGKKDDRSGSTPTRRRYRSRARAEGSRDRSQRGGRQSCLDQSGGSHLARSRGRGECRVRRDTGGTLSRAPARGFGRWGNRAPSSPPRRGAGHRTLSLTRVLAVPYPGRSAPPMPVWAPPSLA